MGEQLPKISIVTPCLNRAAYLEDTIRSILDQDYPALEYIVIDGGSDDGSLEVIRRYADRLAHWSSEIDHNPYDALNKGFAVAGGEIMAWLNADDKLMPWALRVVAEIFRDCPQVEWLTTLMPVKWGAHGLPAKCSPRPGYRRAEFLRGDYTPGIGRYAIQQESTFWRRSLWERTGGCLNVKHAYAADFDLWARFFRHTELWGVPVPLGGFRVHNDQRSAIYMKHYIDEACAILRTSGGRAPRQGRLHQVPPIRRLRTLLRALYASVRRYHYPCCIYDFQACRWRAREFRTVRAAGEPPRQVFSADAHAPRPSGRD